MVSDLSPGEASSVQGGSPPLQPALGSDNPAHPEKASPSATSAQDGAGQPRRRKMSERARELFKKTIGEKKQPSLVTSSAGRSQLSSSDSFAVGNLAYQPRRKNLGSQPTNHGLRSPTTDTAAKNEASYITPGARSIDTRLKTLISSPIASSPTSSLLPSPPPGSQSQLISSRRNSQLTPLIIDNPVAKAEPYGDFEPSSAEKTPTVALAQSSQPRSPVFASPRTPRQPVRKLSLTRNKEAPRISADKPFTRHPFHLHRSKMPNPYRKTSLDLTRRPARGRNIPSTKFGPAVERPPGAFPVAPSYHPDAHPTLQPPKIAFNILDGPTSRDSVANDSMEGGPFTSHRTLPPARLQRPAIKVKIITWNMGGASLPKGDLEVLLGRVGGYVPPDEGWDISPNSEGEEEEDVIVDGTGTDGEILPTKGKKAARGQGVAGQEDTPRHDRIPPLPHDDGHPYHLLIVAGQECPWGDGKRIATGLGVAGELSDLARTKSKAQPSKAIKESALPSLQSATDLWSPGIATPRAFGETEYPFGSPPSTAAPSGVPASITQSKGFRGKGWSDACEDWLCRGPAAQTQATKGLAATAEAVINGKVPSSVPLRETSRAGSPEPAPSASSHAGANSTSHDNSETSDSIFPFGGSPPNHLGLSQMLSGIRSESTSGGLRVPTPTLGRANSTDQTMHDGNVSSSSSALSATETLRIPSPEPPSSELPIVKDFASASATALPAQDVTTMRDGARRQLHLHIPGHHSGNPPHTIGAYELIAKERMAMVYCAVYVWRGCRDRIRGVSCGQVKSGLLAGRVGNKGAVGISVKLGRTRLLFVNSHLAAHEGRVQTRLDNIAKIKRELRVNTFLPPDDARNRLDDVTEMFDHAFWFGDLNFRVDITRQHADWLIMQRRYDQAIEFDQLRKVMKEEREFKGFHEHPITFPPTYKYDVMKTLKKAKKERTVRRILQRRDHAATNLVTSPMDTADDPDMDAPSRWEGMGGGEAPGVVSGRLFSPQPQQQRLHAGQIVSDRDRDRGEYTDDDTSSVSSAAWDSSGYAGQHTTDSDEDLSVLASSSFDTSPVDAVVSSNTSAAQGGAIFSHGAAIKAKLRIIDLVRSATGVNGDNSANQKKRDRHRSRDFSTGSPTTPTTPKSDRSSPVISPGKEPQVLHTSPRRLGPEAATGLARRLSTKAASSVPVLSLRNGSNELRHQNSVSSLASLGGSPKGSRPKTHDEQRITPTPGSRPSFPTVLPRRQSAGDIETIVLGSEHTNKSKTEAEVEEQRYDTSAKQRVPSWTDRILWRSNVAAPGEHESLPGKMSKSISAIKAAAASTSSRASQHIAITGHQAMRGSSRVALPKRSQTFSHPVSSIDRKIAEEDLVESDEGEQSRDAVPQRGRGGHWFHWHGPPKDGSPIGRDDRLGDGSTTPATRNRGASLGTVGKTPEAEEAPDGTATQPSSPSPHPDSPGTSRLRMPTSPKRTASAGHSAPIARPIYARAPLSSPRLSALRAVSSPQTAFSTTETTQVESPTESSEGNGPSSAPNGRIASWWYNHMPSILTAQGAVAALASLGSVSRDPGDSPLSSSAHLPAPVVELVGPKRGDVECLLYKSLDDREMRALEGRSDHRPVIWVGSCGV